MFGIGFVKKYKRHISELSIKKKALEIELQEKHDYDRLLDKVNYLEEENKNLLQTINEITKIKIRENDHIIHVDREYVVIPIKRLNYLVNHNEELKDLLSKEIENTIINKKDNDDFVCKNKNCKKVTSCRICPEYAESIL